MYDIQRLIGAKQRWAAFFISNAPELHVAVIGTHFRPPARQRLLHDYQLPLPLRALHVPHGCACDALHKILQATDPFASCFRAGRSGHAGGGFHWEKRVKSGVEWEMKGFEELAAPHPQDKHKRKQRRRRQKRQGRSRTLCTGFASRSSAMSKGSTITSCTLPSGSYLHMPQLPQIWRRAITGGYRVMCMCWVRRGEGEGGRPCLVGIQSPSPPQRMPPTLVSVSPPPLRAMCSPHCPPRAARPSSRYLLCTWPCVVGAYSANTW